MRNFFMVYVLNTETLRHRGRVCKEEKLCVSESLCSMYSVGADEQTCETRITFLYCV